MVSSFRGVIFALVCVLGSAWNNIPVGPRVLRQSGNELDRRGALSSGIALVAGTVASSASNAAVQVDASKVKTTKSGVKYVIVKEGSCPVIDPSGALGSCYPAPEKYTIIDYTAYLPTGEVFDTTEKKGGKPLAFRLGEKQVIPGIEEVLQYMKPGEEIQALIPASLAYGDKGVCTESGECLVPPGSSLKYYIKLVKVASAAG